MRRYGASPIKDMRLPDLGIVLGKSKSDANQFVLGRFVLGVRRVCACLDEAVMSGTGNKKTALRRF